MNSQLAVLRGLNAVYYATTAILNPLLPIYLAGKGYSSQEVGLFMMIGPFTAVFAQPLFGYLSDRFQTLKKIIFPLWLCGLAASFGLFAVTGFTSTFIFSLLVYLFILPSIPLLDSLVIKATHTYGVSYGSVRLWGSIGFSGMALATGLMLPFIGGVDNMKYVYWIAWLLPFLLLLKQKDEKSTAPPISLKAIGALLGNRPFLWYLLMIFLIMVPHRMNDVLLGLHMSELNASAGMISAAWSIAAFSEIPAFALLSRYMHRFHELALLGIVSILYAIRWVAFALVDDPFILMILQASHMITFAVFWVVAVQYTVRLVPEELRSTGQSLLSAVFLGLAGLTGGYVGGIIQDAWNGSGMYMAGAFLAAVAAVMFLSTHAYQRRKAA
ncbi:MFS transporter [Paenibacillus sp. MBLB4367]|uniref:MFS transporter n=1 Tax=Paenibacillus sp. MBLB4367 TaxID=3384767 RepID=UPI003908450A